MNHACAKSRMCALCLRVLASASCFKDGLGHLQPICMRKHKAGLVSAFEGQAVPLSVTQISGQIYLGGTLSDVDFSGPNTSLFLSEGKQLGTKFLNASGSKEAQE